MLARIRRHPIVCFVVVTYAVTWSLWIPLALGNRVTVGSSPAFVLGLFGPMIGAFVTTAIVSGRRGVRDLFARMVRFRAGRWWLIALALPVAIGAGAVMAMWMVAPGELPAWRELGQFNGFPVVNAVALWAMLIASGYGEETGWRGFLLPQLRGHAPLRAGLVVGVFWALWHVPAFFVVDTYRSMPIAMLPMFFLGILSGSVFLTWLYNRGRRSIALVAVWHGTYNLLSGTVAARGALAAAESTAVMIIAGVLLIRECIRAAFCGTKVAMEQSAMSTNQTIRYDDGIVWKYVTATIVLGAVGILAAGLLAFGVATRGSAEVWLERITGPSFVELPDGQLASQVRLKLENETNDTRHYTISIAEAMDAKLRISQQSWQLGARKSIEIPLVVDVPRASFVRGERRVTLRVDADDGFQRMVTVTLLGPADGGTR
jgi:CAAX protease family protein